MYIVQLIAQKASEETGSVSKMYRRGRKKKQHRPVNRLSEFTCRSVIRIESNFQTVNEERVPARHVPCRLRRCRSAY